MNRKLLVSALSLVLAHIMVGCGAPAAPAPPSLNLPAPVENLSAVRMGDTVHLTWTMPRRTTDHIALKHPVAAQICRAVESGPCTAITSLTLMPGAAATYADTLAADLIQGSDRLLRYEVSLRNRAGKSAGPSNAAFSAAGASPAAVTEFSGQISPHGVLLSWKPMPEPGMALTFRIERQLLTIPAQETNHSPLAAAAPSVNQTLEVHSANGSDPGHAVDSSAVFNQKYRYSMERITILTQRKIEVQGAPSAAIEVTTVDNFPPAIPEGLVAVADAAGGAIDLSWSPDTDSDLAGYRVYRRDLQGGQAGQRIASQQTETSYRDTGVQAGHTYAYSVSAFDQSGNESKPSAEAEETLPQP
jgi:hypothetical protein